MRNILITHVLNHHQWKDSRTIKQEVIDYRIANKWFFTPRWWIETVVSGSLYVNLHQLEEAGLLERRPIPRLTEDLRGLRIEMELSRERSEWRLKTTGRRRRTHPDPVARPSLALV